MTDGAIQDAAVVNDAESNEARLAPLYDILDADRSDLNTYLAIVEAVGARSVLDIGCGTGVFALKLVERGVAVTGVDPAGPSLDVARAKPGADQVTWVLGDATALPPLQVDLVTMTANVAQFIVAEDVWSHTLSRAYASLLPGGELVFESRKPEARTWESWVLPESRSTTDVPGFGPVTEWYDIDDVTQDPLLVTFTAHNEFPNGEDVTSTSTLRFRTAEEFETSLTRAGFVDVRITDLPYAPRDGWLIQARRSEDVEAFCG